MLKVILNYWYLKLNFLIPENLIWDTSSVIEYELECKDKSEICQHYILWQISVWDIETWLYMFQSPN